MKTGWRRPALAGRPGWWTLVGRPGLWAARTVIAVTAVTTATLLYAQQQQQPPPRQVFRGGANFVLVDAYPSRDGQIVEGLTATDFEILEDGKPQKIEAFEFVRVEHGLSESERRDPNNQREVIEAVADPHNRIFVVFLDISHVTVEGSHRIRRPLIDALNRIIAPNDLFAVTTSYHRAKDLVFGRRLMGLEEQLSKFWTWGERNMITSSRPLDLRETELTNCFHVKLKVDNPRDPKIVTPIDWLVKDGPVKRFFDEVLIERLREDRALTSLEDHADYIGQLREARTVLMPITDGWVLFEPNRSWEAEPSDDVRNAGQSVPTAAAQLGPRGQRDQNQIIDWQRCLIEMNRLVQLDNERRLRDLIAKANRNNVSFYPVAPAGLAAFDGGGASERVIPNPSAPLGQTILGRDQNRLRSRVDGLKTIAENTDGIAIVDTNDLQAGFKRIVNDVSAYYLLGYSSTNPAQDGRYRKIDVKVATRGATVRARRGYVSARPAAAASTGTETGPAAAVATSALNDALSSLARLTPTASLFVTASAGAELTVVAELASQTIARGPWPQGATVTIEVSDAKGVRAADATAKIEPGMRSTLVRVPLAGPGPWRVRTRVAGGPDGPLEDRLEVPSAASKFVGIAVAFRATPAPASPLRPAAEFLYRRTERVHIEWPILTSPDRREARLIGRNGQPLAVPVTVSERETNGQRTLAADVNLAPLSAGDYVIELTVGSGDATERKLFALRVVQ